MRIEKWALVAALVLSASPALAANGAKGDWELGGFGGHGWLDDYRTIRPRNDLLYGARLGYFLSPQLSLEVSAQRLPTDTRTVPSHSMNINSYRGNALFSLVPGSRWQPFLTAGGGYENTDISGFDNSSNFAWNAGGGARVYLAPRVSVRAEGRFNQVKVDALNHTEGNAEAMLGVSVLLGEHAERPQEPVERPRAENERPQISCATDRSEVQPGESVTINATATDPEGGPLTYAWSSSAGRLSGSGSSATLNLDGSTVPSTVTVTVRATDDHGHTASSECSVRVVEPPRSAEEISCLAGGFPRNLSRLTNVDKACLDDIVTRLRSDPRARVVVIGHADGRETSPERIGRQRATAVKDYLVQAGIDAARVSTRSAGNSNPLDTGTDAAAMARNRRVMVWFVPEGAKEPD